ncbi:hypothetical protein CEXT_321151 [Caerostris extrusa]|uniref:Uncharacterized protein n=1 Tax=Caerostris extrusa TaxID=172846 RepID=A0AAV4VQB6_CAEEX|nr:hypothetical protein CEXT_321151 [Caerostris extrusa]
MVVAGTLAQTELPVWNEEIMLVPLGYRMKRNCRSSAKDRSGHITAARGWVMRLLQVNVLGLSRPLSPRGGRARNVLSPPVSLHLSSFLTLIGSILRVAWKSGVLLKNFENN